MIFYEVINNKEAEFRSMGAKFGISRNTCATLMAKAQSELVKYDITSQELMNAIKTLGNEKVASYLSPEPSSEPIEKIVKDDPNIDDKTPAEKQQSDEQSPGAKVEKGDSFKEKFDKLMMDNAAWTPHIREVDAANWLYYWIESGFKSPTEVGAKFGISKADSKWWHPKAMRLLKKYNLTEEDIKKAVKRFGKKKVTDMIGSNNDDGSW
jgi:hypothetical protein